MQRSKALLPWLMAGAFALLALSMVAIHYSELNGQPTELLQKKPSRKSSEELTQQINQLSKLLLHPNQLAQAMTTPVADEAAKISQYQKKSLRSMRKDQLKQQVRTAKLEGEEEEEEDEGDEEPTEYYQSAFPSFNRKGVGPGLSTGDPVLNKKTKYRYYKPCTLVGNCVDEQDEKYLEWRSLKMTQDTADDEMGVQLAFLFQEAGHELEACEEGFGEDEEGVDQCQKKVTRAMCYKFENINHICDWADKSRYNHHQGTVYFAEKYKLAACTNEAKMAMEEMCQEAEKLPGVSISHWPWQGFSMNLGKRGFSGDYFLGPYAWSGRMNHAFS